MSFGCHLKPIHMHFNSIKSVGGGMKQYKSILPFLMVLFLSSCIGTDIVEDLWLEPRLQINSRLVTLGLGETFQLSVEYFNKMGVAENVPVNWHSSDPSIISIDMEGYALAQMMGEVTITASFMGTEDSIVVKAANNTMEAPNRRTGSFRGANNYSVNGDFMLEEVDGKLRLTFDANFSASSGPGLFIYLSNQTNSISGALELGRIQANSGVQIYETDLQNAGLNTYDFVLVWCKPFGVLFGSGQLEN